VSKINGFTPRDVPQFAVAQKSVQFRNIPVSLATLLDLKEEVGRVHAIQAVVEFAGAPGNFFIPTKLVTNHFTRWHSGC
jgi:hypothetical protein